jgi:hypothetical protein
MASTILPQPIENTESMDFTRHNIELLKSDIRLVDSDENLDLFCYINCEKDSPDFIKRCRGVIFNKDELVFKSFPYTIEYTEKNDTDKIKNNVESIFSDCLFYKSYEGCLIRIFYFKNKWYISTNKKLDAFKSKWSSKESYGNYFKKALHTQFSTNKRLIQHYENIEKKLPKDDEQFSSFCTNVLEKDKQYVFLLLNSSDNRIVCDEPDTPTIFHVGTFINGNLDMCEDIYIPYPEKLEFENIDKLYEYVNKTDYTKLQGVIIFAPNNIQYKILNYDYYYYYNARGNEPSIKFRYLQVRMDKEQSKMLKFLYPNKIKEFEEYENLIFEASQLIYNSYVERFIKKMFVNVPPEEYQIMKSAHSWYLTDRKINKINYDVIINILNQQTPTNVNKIIKRIKLSKLPKHDKSQRILV